MAPSRTQSMAAGLGAAIGATLSIALALIVLGDRLWARADDMAAVKARVEQIDANTRETKMDIREIKSIINASAPTPTRIGRRE